MIPPIPPRSFQVNSSAIFEENPSIGISLRVNYFSTIALRATQIEFSIARLSFFYRLFFTYQHTFKTFYHCIQKIVLKYIELVYKRALTCGCNNNNNC